jgi:hypothetical protein
MEGLGSLLNSLLARQVGMSIHGDPFKNSMDPYGILNTPQAQQVYGPMPMEQAPGNMEISGGFEEEPKQSKYPVQFGNLQLKPNVDYSTGQTSYGIPGLKSKLINSYLGGNFNYPLGENGLSLEGAYGKARGAVKQQYMDNPSESYITSSYPFNLGIKFNRDF